MARTKQTARYPPQSKLKPLKALDPLPMNTQSLLRPGPEAVAYHIPTSPPGPAQPILKTTIALPAYSKWTSGLHFHTSHTEYLRLIKGCIFVELDGDVRILSAKAGGAVSIWRPGVQQGLEVKVDRYARHSWGRARQYFHRRYFGRRPAYPEDIDEEVVVEEWTDPADIVKPLFFWNLNGVITAPQDAKLSRRQSFARSVSRAWWIPFQLLIIFWDLDNWPVFLSMTGLSDHYLPARMARYINRLVEHVMTFAVLFTAKVLGHLLGLRGVSEGRTPDELWKAYARHDC